MSSLPLYFPQNFSLDRALRCAQLVEQAYAQYQQWQVQGRPRRPQDFHWNAPQLDGWRFSAPIWSILSDLRFINESEPFGFAAANDQGETYLVLRGTESAQDWLDDLDLQQARWPWQDGVTGSVHAGFLKLYTSLRDLALAALDSLQPSGPLWVCGHSLGSALSSLAVLDLHDCGRTRRCSTTTSPARAWRLQTLPRPTTAWGCRLSAWSMTAIWYRRFRRRSVASCCTSTSVRP